MPAASERSLDEARAIEAEARLAAPEIRRPERCSATSTKSVMPFRSCEMRGEDESAASRGAAYRREPRTATRLLRRGKSEGRQLQVRARYTRRCGSRRPGALARAQRVRATRSAGSRHSRRRGAGPRPSPRARHRPSRSSPMSASVSRGASGEGWRRRGAGSHDALDRAGRKTLGLDLSA